MGPHAPRLGGALVTWVEPMPDHVVGYDRCDEDDHMITRPMVMPWMFSCRRWVTPRWLQHLLGPCGSRVAGHDPLEGRRHVFTAFHDHLGPTYRDDAVPRDVHALVQPYEGLVVEVIDAIAVLHLLEVDPRTCWEELTAGDSTRLTQATAGKGVTPLTT